MSVNQLTEAVENDEKVWWLYANGYTIGVNQCEKPNAMNRLKRYGPYIESKRDISLPYMGSSNQRVIDCYASLCCKKPVLWWNPNNKKENT